MRLALLFGDDIGPEITLSAQRVVDAAAGLYDFELHWDEVVIGLESLFDSGTTLTDAAVETARQADGVILGPVSHNDYPPRADGGLNPSGELRKRLDLFANIRPSRTRAAVAAPAGIPFDLVIVRENTEGFYADRNMHLGDGDMLVTEDVAIGMRRITRAASMRIAEEAFRLARTRNRKVTAVHKANVMRQTCGLFLECCRHHAARNPDIAYEEQLIDAMCAHLVRAPQAHDVIVTTNMFGDILSDLAAELSGGLGLGASLNAGTHHAMAQAQHGSAPDIALQDRANPSAMIGSAAMLLRWLGARHGASKVTAAGDAIEHALEAALSDQTTCTADLGGPLGTKDFTSIVIERLETPLALAIPAQ